ncbi:hypothetical protein ACQWU4_18375 [Chryseobacterium sp. MIQD13]|uniref:hypothetical protein n=1 Tax=Chryseobacterium sp. MIQD13 TaxID=3422310 RepID=UPI003D2DDED1
MKKTALLFVMSLIIFACKKNDTEKRTLKASNYNDESTEYYNNYSENEYNDDEYTESDDEQNENYYDEEQENENSFEDGKRVYNGTLPATVRYYNPETGYSNTYTLDVDVNNGEVERINFPKGGWLDDDVHPIESRLSSEELDENGTATLKDSDGRTFEVEIDD